MVAVLQFWGDVASSADGILYGGREWSISALAEYVLSTINPGLETGSKITWDDIVIRTPWMAKQLHGMMAAQEKTVRCQALPVPGMSSELEIILERRYSKHILSSSMGRGKPVAKNPATPADPSPKPVTSPPRLTKAGWGDVLKLHLKRATQGEGWSQVEPKDSGPDVGCLYRAPKEADKPQEVAQPGRSPLTSKLLAPGKELIGDLDYEEVEEADPGLIDPEIVQAVAHIPLANASADVEMQETHSPLGFEPEVSRSGYDVNLVHNNPTEPGSASPVMAREDKMLDEEANSRTPGAGQPGTNEDPGHTEDN